MLTNILFSLVNLIPNVLEETFRSKYWLQLYPLLSICQNFTLILLKKKKIHSYDFIIFHLFEFHCDLLRDPWNDVYESIIIQYYVAKPPPPFRIYPGSRHSWEQISFLGRSLAGIFWILLDLCITLFIYSGFWYDGLLVLDDEWKHHVLPRSDSRVDETQPTFKLLFISKLPLNIYQSVPIS